MKDITGKIYGMLTVVECVGKSKEGRKKWLCKCKCGGSGVYYKNNLDAGRSHCGCEANRRPNLKHGLRFHELYPTWKSMVSRCHNKKSKDYKNYGARGITVCEKWRNDVSAFISDMHPRPKGHTLDRINVNKGYSPDNCRWAIQALQHENRKITARLNNGMSVNEVSKLTGVSDRTIYMRLYRGWTDEEIISGTKNKAVAPS